MDPNEVTADVTHLNDNKKQLLLGRIEYFDIIIYEKLVH